MSARPGPGRENQPSPLHWGRLLGERLQRLLVPVVMAELALVALLAAVAWHSTSPDGIDTRVSSALYSPPGSGLRSTFSALTVLGSPAVAIAAALAVTALVWWRTRDAYLTVFCPLAVVCSAVAESVAKKLVDRARPTTAALAHVHGQSFPSGHATVAVALAVAAGLLAAALGLRRRHLVAAALGAYAVVICVSRIVLGVHYLTDVLAGAALAGAVVLCVAWATSLAAERAG